MHRLPIRAVTLLLATLALVAVVAACGGSSGATAQGAAGAGGPAVLAGRTIIDVRTPAEYAAGHIAGAQNIDYEAADFGTRIEALDKAAPYVVYCRSGRRSALAQAQMKDAGFTDVKDGGAMDALVAAGAKTGQ
jgi:rhodanese-related sulfurtransferase